MRGNLAVFQSNVATHAYARRRFMVEPLFFTDANRIATIGNLMGSEPTLPTYSRQSQQP